MDVDSVGGGPNQKSLGPNIPTHPPHPKTSHNPPIRQMFYAFFAPLEAFAVPALTSMAGFSDRKASLGASILPALSIILSPPFGAVVDRELGKGVGGRRHRSTNPSCLQRLWPPGSTQLWAMLLPALGIGAIIVHPSLWALGFGLISLGYALSCASLWIVIPECESAARTDGLVERLHPPGNTNTPSISPPPIPKHPQSLPPAPSASPSASSTPSTTRASSPCRSPSGGCSTRAAPTAGAFCRSS